MSEKITEEVILESKVNQRPFLADIRYKQDNTQKPVIVFVHGFKGFKDWGHFNLLADKFAEQGFVFIKFNLSHNGTTIQSPLDFDDLAAFAENNFTKEIEDITAVIDYIHSKENEVPANEFDLNRLFIIGHSRGGGISIVKASEDDRIKGIATWAALNNFKMGTTPDSIDIWRKQGVIYAENTRTNQKIPMNFQLYEDYHVFGGTHPFNDSKLHKHAHELLNKTVTFFKNL